LEHFLAGDPAGAATVLKEARKINPSAEEYLIGRKSLPKMLPEFFGFGDKNKAVICADAIGAAWRKHPEIVEWPR